MGRDDFTRFFVADDLPVAENVNPDGSAPILLVCEHASARIPSALDDLGLRPEDRYSHAAWDLGAEALSRRLSEMLDAPLVLCRVSRLVYDCNRPPERPDACPDRVETIAIPGNRGVDADARLARARAVYEPFHASVGAALDRFPTPPALVTIHSFTPSWHGSPRAVEFGFLHDADPALALAMFKHRPEAYRTELNQPYSAQDGVTHTLQRHANGRGLANVMIEVRNDLLSDPESIDDVAQALARTLAAATGKVQAA